MIDATDFMGRPRFEFALHAPSGEETTDQDGAGGIDTLLHKAIYRVVFGQPDHTVGSQRRWLPSFARRRRASAIPRPVKLSKTSSSAAKAIA